MMPKNPFDSSFDPYDALIELNERISRMEHAHNKLAEAFQRTERELNQALSSLRHLQQGHLKLSQLVTATAMDKFDIKPDEIYGKNRS